MHVSVVDPLTPAFGWTRTVLFGPFDAKKWLLLGFCAFLANCGQGGGGGSSWNLPGSRDDSGASFLPGTFEDWILTHVSLAVGIGILVFAVLVLLGVVVLWLSSRGKFMFLDGVVCNRGLVSEPWRKFRDLGNSLFIFRLMVSIIGLLVFSTLIGGTAALLWSNFRDESFTPGAIFVLILAFASGMGFAIVMGLIQMVTDDFFVPIMYLRGCSVGAAWAELKGLMSDRIGTFVVYVLVRLLITIVSFLITLIAVFCTLCIVIIPYIGTVILLPIFVFLRSFPLYFLAQFGGELERFGRLGRDSDEVARVFE